MDRLQSDSSHAIDFSAHEMSAHGSSGIDLRNEHRRTVAINFAGERNAVARLLHVNGYVLSMLEVFTVFVNRDFF